MQRIISFIHENVGVIQPIEFSCTLRSLFLCPLKFEAIGEHNLQKWFCASGDVPLRVCCDRNEGILLHTKRAGDSR